MKISLNKIATEIEKFESIIILTHVNPDPDAFGSSFALKESIMATYPEKKVYVICDQIRRYSVFFCVDTIKDEAVFEKSLVISVDAANKERISDMRYDKASQVIKIDHHIDVDQYADFQFVDEKACASSEIIYQLITSTNLEMNKKIGEYLYLGILGDTDRFLFESASDKVFCLVGQLIKDYQIDRTKMHNFLYTKELKELQIISMIYDTLKLENGLGVIKITKDMLKQINVKCGDVSQFVNSVNFVKDMKVWVMFIEDEKNKIIKTSIRSKEIAINDIAAKYNGGGHKNASGARVHTWEQANEMCQDIIEKINEA